nr:polyketide synthase 7/nonribosomal peptide synthetase [Elsinoe perseae]
MQQSLSDDAIAIVGSACRFPGGVKSPETLWELLADPYDVLGEIPPDRYSHDRFYHSRSGYHGHINVSGSYTLEEDVHAFDAQFFKISAAEASAMDPQHRLLLESVYHALEAAGMPMENLVGSDTGVFVGCMNGDYEFLSLRDLDTVPMYHATGVSRSILANRISYFFDWHGPSLALDTACSSSLYAVHLAAQALERGEAKVAVACGTNLILGPHGYLTTGNMHMLSPDGRCKMWDESANGYGRGEAVGVVILKRLGDALADGDDIECIIRQTAVNQDGATSGITMPSGKAQKNLIVQTYRKAGLDPIKSRCQYFEAHGTGTQAGDPMEAEAIWRTFRGDSSTEDAHPLYVGSIKTILGHSESTAGIAGILKASLALQHAKIPPNMLLRHINPRLHSFYDGLEIPQSLLSWPPVPPGQPRRASVNSFGFGGANAHAILESFEEENKPYLHSKEAPCIPYLFSAHSETALLSMLRAYSEYLEGRENTLSYSDLGYTLSRRRSMLPVRTHFPASSVETLKRALDDKLRLAHDESTNVGNRANLERGGILGIFTGQGAQYSRMAYELLKESKLTFHLFDLLQGYLDALPTEDRPTWTIAAELSADGSESRLHEAHIAQPLCTAVQIVLVDILRAAGVQFAAVVGHSSGEIAAAYAAGYLSRRDAIVIAYYRGLHVKHAHNPREPSIKGAMIVLGLAAASADQLLHDVGVVGQAEIAAINSSQSTTVSGDKEAIERIEHFCLESGTFHRRLHVDRAYHSFHMKACAHPYEVSLRRAGCQVAVPLGTCSWISSLQPDLDMKSDEAKFLLMTEYWSKNMTHPVLFSEGLQKALEGVRINSVIEIGPHPALKSPAELVIKDSQDTGLPYFSTLKRKVGAIRALSDTIGNLWCHQQVPEVDPYKLSQVLHMTSLKSRVIKGLPLYEFDRSQSFRSGQRQTQQICQRPDRLNPLIGHQSPDNTADTMSWRHFLKTNETTWLLDHRLQDKPVLPATYYICALLEASYQVPTRSEQIRLVEIQDMRIHQAVAVTEDSPETPGIEVIINITDIQRHKASNMISATFKLNAARDRSDTLALRASAIFKIHLGPSSSSVLQPVPVLRNNLLGLDTERIYEHLERWGYEYRGRFRSLMDVQRRYGFAEGHISSQSTEGGDGHSILLHPATLDVALQLQMFSWCSVGDEELKNLLVPTHFQRILVNLSSCILSNKAGSPLGVTSCLVSRDIGAISSNIEVHGTDGNPIIQIEKLKMSYVIMSQQHERIFAGLKWSVMSPDDSKLELRREMTVSEIQLLQIADRLAFSFDDDIHIRIIRRVGEALPRAIAGETTMIESLFSTDIITKYYRSAAGMDVGVQWSAGFVEQISHRFPNMHVLEVGAGTGGTTHEILRKRGCSIASYTFTDVSTGFLEKARGEYSGLLTKMQYRSLDISKDPAMQGFDLASFDMVVATDVVHATHSILQSLRNIRTLTKPGGYLVLKETMAPDMSKYGFVFGTLSGWWLGAGEGRTLSPLVKLEQWDSLLRQAGFSGVLCRSPAQLEETAGIASIVSQAVNDEITNIIDPLSVKDSQKGTLLLIGGASGIYHDLLIDLRRILSGFYNEVICYPTIGDVRDQKFSTPPTIISVTELANPFLEHGGALDLEKWKRLLSLEGILLWVTSGRRYTNPSSSASIGLWENFRTELHGLRFQSLDFDSPSSIRAETIAVCVRRLELAGFSDKRQDVLWTSEPQVVVDESSRLLIPRYYSLDEANLRYHAAQNTVKHSMHPTKTMIELKQDSMGDYSFVIVPSISKSHAGESHEYLAKGARCTPKERLVIAHTILTPMTATAKALYLSFAYDPSSQEKFLTFGRTPRSLWTQNNDVIPVILPDMSPEAFLSAVAMEIWITEILDSVTSGQQILMHCGNIEFGRHLVDRSAHRDIEVIFTTNSKDIAKEHDWLFVPPFSTAEQIRSILPKKPDVCLLFEKGLEAIFQETDDCRFINFDPFLSSVTDSGKAAWSGAELHSMWKKKIEEAAFRVNTAGSWTSHKPTSLALYPHDLEKKTGAKTHWSILHWLSGNPSMISCEVRPLDSYQLFTRSKTYWLIGMTRDLGLSTCDWMIQHGATHIVLSSRNPNVDPAWLSNHEKSGITIKVMVNDITDKAAVSQILAQIDGTLPSLAGIIFGAMILKDTSVQAMTWEDLSVVLAPKVIGSRNLDECLGDRALDFLLFCSSIVNVVGNPGQAAYCAANAYMTSLAFQRSMNGKRTAVVHMGPVAGSGYMTREVEEGSSGVSSTRSGLRQMSENDIFQIFAEGIELATRSAVSSTEVDPQIGFGLDIVHRMLPSHVRPDWLMDPRLQAFSATMDTQRDDMKESLGLRVPLKDRMAITTSKQQLLQIVQECLFEKIQLLMRLQEITLHDFLQLRTDDMAIHSLMAVDIRSWLINTFKASVPVFEILSGISMGNLAQSIANLIPAHLTPRMVDDTLREEARESFPEAERLSDEQIEVVQGDTGGSPSPSTQTQLHDSNNQSLADSRADGTMSMGENNARDSGDYLSDEVPSIPTSTDPQFIREHKLTAIQSMFWMAESISEDKTILNHTATYRVYGLIKMQDLRSAIISLVDRHQSLRTAFRENEDGRVTQHVMTKGHAELEVRHITTEKQRLDECSSLKKWKYDLRSGRAIRFVLLKGNSEVGTYLLIGAHHLIIDGLCQRIVVRDLVALYERRGFSLNRNVQQYLDWAASQDTPATTLKWACNLDFWKTELGAMPGPLPLTRARYQLRRPLTVFDDNRLEVRIPNRIVRKAWEAARLCRASPFHVYLAAFAALLANLMDDSDATSRRDICIGTADSNRGDPDSLDSIGCYINLLPLVFRGGLLEASCSCESLIQQAKSITLQAMKQAVPFDTMLTALKVSRTLTYTPIFQAFLDYRQGSSRNAQKLGDCSIELLELDLGRTLYDISIDINDAESLEGDAVLMLGAHSALYTMGDANVLASCYIDVLDTLVSDPTLKVTEVGAWAAVSVQPSINRETSLSELGTVVYTATNRFSVQESGKGWSETLLLRLQDIAGEYRDKVAMFTAEEQNQDPVTYEQFWQSVESLACLLQRSGIHKGKTVAIFQTPTQLCIAAIFAIFMRGAIFVPLDPTLPAARLELMVARCKPMVVLFDGDAGISDPPLAAKTINLRVPPSDQYPDNTAQTPIFASDPAYIIFTSGTTGEPKGVIGNHGALSHSISSMGRSSGLDDSVVLLQQSSFGFDMSFAQIFVTLSLGGTLCLLPLGKRSDLTVMADVISRYHITCTIATPTEYAAWLRYADLERLRQSRWMTAITGGESVQDQFLQHLRALDRPDLKVYNAYGPTETTMCSAIGQIPYRDVSLANQRSVGYALEKESIYILDSNLRPVPLGLPGEVYIGGSGVTLGYLNDPLATAHAFLENPFATEQFKNAGWTRMYKTGDRGRLDDAGNLLLEGRFAGDSQVKVNGIRIELVEIETCIVLASEGRIVAAAATVRANNNTEFIVCHVVLKEVGSCDPPAVGLSQLAEKLPIPKSVRPTMMIPVPKLPMTIAGKLDRNALQHFPLSSEMTQLPAEDDEDDQQIDDVWNGLREAWLQVLPSNHASPLQSINSDADFFSIGGTSISLLELRASIKRKFAVTIPIAELFECSRFGDMLRRLSTTNNGQHRPDVDWSMEATIPSNIWDSFDTSQITNAANRTPVRHPPETVLITGATGQLGSRILDKLLENKKITRILCIGIRSLEKKLADGTIPQPSEKLAYFPGDLSRPRLGLSSADFNSLSAIVDLVVHIGADVSHGRTYQTMKSANVGSASELARLCLVRETPLHFVSSSEVALLGSPQQRIVLREQSLCSQNIWPDQEDAVIEGYGASKWVAEKLLEDLASRSGLPVWIHRPASIIDRLEDLYRETDKFTIQRATTPIIQALFHYCWKLKMVPSTKGWAEGTIHFVRTDSVAESILETALSDSHHLNSSVQDSTVRYRHQIGTTRVPIEGMKDFMENVASGISQDGQTFQEVLIEEWIEAAEAEGLHKLTSFVLRSLHSRGSKLYLADLSSDIVEQRP